MRDEVLLILFLVSGSPITASRPDIQGQDTVGYMVIEAIITVFVRIPDHGALDNMGLVHEHGWSDPLTLGAETGESRTVKFVGLLKDRDLSEEAHVHADPEVGIEANLYPTIRVEEALRAVTQPIDEFIHAELAVVDAHGIVDGLIVVALIVQVEVHSSLHAASDTGFHESTHANARGRSDTRMEHDLRPGRVDDIEPIEDVVRSGETAIHKLTHPGRVIAEVQIHCGPDSAVQLRKQKREDLEALHVVEADIKLGHVELKQIHILAEQQFDCCGRIGEDRQLEEILGAADKSLGAVGRSAKLIVEVELTGRQPGVIGVRVCVARVHPHLSQRVGAEVDDDAVGVGGNRVDEVDDVSRCGDELQFRFLDAERAGQIQECQILIRQIRDDRQPCVEEVNHGLDGFRDNLDVVQDRPHEVAQE